MDPSHSSTSKDGDDDIGERYSVRGWWGYLFMSHMTPLIRLGATRPLEQKDLGNVPKSAKYSATMPMWNKHWAEEMKLPPEKRSLIRPLRRAIFTRKIAFASLVLIVSSGAPFANPLILKAITQYQLGILQISLAEKWILIALTFVLPLTAVLMSGYANSTFELLSVRVRNMLGCVIFEKLLGMRASNVESGPIINMLNTDLRNIEMFFVIVPTSLFLPAQVAVCIWLLYREVNVSIFAGFAYQICIMPFALAVMVTVGKFFEEKQKLTDQRLKVVNEIMNGIRVVKFYGWEKAFQQMIQDIRIKEVGMTQRVGAIFAFGDTIIRSANTILPVIIFYCFMRLDNVMTPDIPFVVLTYIGVLAAGVSSLPAIINYMMQVSACCSRILALLNKPDMKNYVLSEPPPADSPYADCLVIFDHASLGWELMKDSAEDTKNIEMKGGEMVPPLPLVMHMQIKLTHRIQEVYPREVKNMKWCLLLVTMITLSLINPKLITNKQPSNLQRLRKRVG